MNESLFADACTCTPELDEDGEWTGDIDRDRRCPTHGEHPIPEAWDYKMAGVPDE